MNVSVVECADEFLGLLAGADHLVDTSNPGAIFALPTFYRAYWSVYGKDLDLFALVVRDGDAIAAILPLVAQSAHVTSRRRLSLEILGANVCDFSYFPGCENPDVMDAILRFLAQWRNRWAVVRFPFVRDGSQLLASTRNAVRDYGIYVHARQSDVNCWLDLSAESAGAVTSFNRTMRNQIRRLKRISDLQLIEHRDPEAVVKRLPHLMHMHVLRWLNTENPSKFQSRRSRDWYYRMACLLGRDHIVLFELRWNDRSIAYVFGFALAQRYLLYTQTYDQTLHEYSPGRLLNSLMVQLAVGSDAYRAIDYLRGDEAYKFFVTSNVLPLWETRIYFRSYDRLCRRVTLRLRQQAKSLIMRRSATRVYALRLRKLWHFTLARIRGPRSDEAFDATKRLAVYGRRVEEWKAPPEGAYESRWESVGEEDWPKLSSFFGATNASRVRDVLLRLWHNSWRSMALVVDGNVLGVSMYKVSHGTATSSKDAVLSQDHARYVLVPILSPAWSDGEREAQSLVQLLACLNGLTQQGDTVLMHTERWSMFARDIQEQGIRLSTTEASIEEHLRIDGRAFLALRLW